MPITGMSRTAGKRDTKIKIKVVKNKAKAAAKSSAKPAAASVAVLNLVQNLSTNRCCSPPPSPRFQVDAERYALVLESINGETPATGISRTTRSILRRACSIFWGSFAAQMRKPTD